MSTLPSIGEEAPSFSAKDAEGNIISSSSLKGQPYVLYFYPKDDTPGCTAEACSFRDHQAHVDELNARLIGISPDSTTSHARFAQKYGLNFTLLSDENHRIAEAFGVWQEKNHFGQKKMGVVRTTFIVDSQGVIRWIESPVTVEGHTERVLEFLRTYSEET